MANNKSIQILRGNGHAQSTTLLAGQPYYDKTNNLLFVGDGSSTIANLKPITVTTDTYYIYTIYMCRNILQEDLTKTVPCAWNACIKVITDSEAEINASYDKWEDLYNFIKGSLPLTQYETVLNNIISCSGRLSVKSDIPYNDNNKWVYYKGYYDISDILFVISTSWLSPFRGIKFTASKCNYEIEDPYSKGMTYSHTCIGVKETDYDYSNTTSSGSTRTFADIITKSPAFHIPN